MNLPSVVLAASDAVSERLLPTLRRAGFEVTRIAPDEARPERIRELSPRVLLLECATDEAPALQPFWADRAMDAHVPILLLRPGGVVPIPRPDLDEPVEEIDLGADPGEVAARTRGLIREGLIRIFRKSFHDLSQPLTIARALSRKAVKLSSPAESVDATLQELDRQVERIFRIAEELQRRRGE
ncbi:MAG: hypothetical protein L0170_12395 [Acidobacteria bacterium]|nr:hypothetical protein [Acidobacteriota bacterium]